MAEYQSTGMNAEGPSPPIKSLLRSKALKCTAQRLSDGRGVYKLLNTLVS